MRRQKNRIRFKVEDLQGGSLVHRSGSNILHPVQLLASYGPGAIQGLLPSFLMPNKGIDNKKLVN